MAALDGVYRRQKGDLKGLCRSIENPRGTALLRSGRLIDCSHRAVLISIWFVDVGGTASLRRIDEPQGWMINTSIRELMRELDAASAWNRRGMPPDPVGQIVEIWRYPLTSVGGERLACTLIGHDGVAGDREYGLIDSATGQPAAPEREIRWRKALHLKAICGTGSGPEIIFPTGHTLPVSDPALNSDLSDYFGFDAAVAAYAHTKQPMGLPQTRYRHRHFPMHILTTSSLEQLALMRQAATVDIRRFRPTVLIDAGGVKGFVENGWVGRRLRLGGMRLTVQEDTKRCGVTFISQPGLEEDPEILRSILRHNGRI